MKPFETHPRGGLESDLISWDDETPDSLLRVTETHGKSELPAPRF